MNYLTIVCLTLTLHYVTGHLSAVPHGHSILNNEGQQEEDPMAALDSTDGNGVHYHEATEACRRDCRLERLACLQIAIKYKPESPAAILEMRLVCNEKYDNCMPECVRIFNE